MIELFLPEIKAALAQKDYEALKALISEIPSVDLAEGFDAFVREEQDVLLRLLPRTRAIQVFEELDPACQQSLLQNLGDETTAPILEGMPVEATAAILKKMPGKMVKKMTSLLQRGKMETVTDLMSFPENAVGSVMQVDVMTLSPELSATAAIQQLQARLRLRQADNIGTIFVTQEDRRPIGAVTLSALVAAPSTLKVREIMTPIALIKIPATLDKEEAAKTFSRYHLDAAPVVDEEGRLVGLLKSEDIIEIIESASTEDIHKLAGVEALDEPYFKISFLSMVKKRAKWLCVLFLGEMLTATAMGFFEHQIAKAVVLALFIPLIISSGGNSGSQAATLVVRAMALKEVGFRDWWRVMRREFASGLVLGLILGVIGFCRIALWAQFSDVYGEHYLLVAATVGSALVLVVMWGSLSGSLLPIALKRIGLDPAVVSAPFVATLVDVTGLVIYFSVAIFFMKGTVL